MKLLADEGFNGNFVRALRSKGFEVEWVLESRPGITDREVIAHASTNSQLLLTEDKDFGEWVFAHKVSGVTIVFVRYTSDEVNEMVEALVQVLTSLSRSAGVPHEFITITTRKIRRRSI